MKYTKPALTFEEQADLLISRGLGLVAEKDKLLKILKAVNYYRLSAYWFPYKTADEKFIPDTTLEIVWSRYTFDRQLRLLVMDAIERVEIVLKTQIAAFFSLRHGPFGYLKKENFSDKMTDSEYSELLKTLRYNTGKSRETFVKHYFEKYNSEHDLPLWMAVEIMTFGNMLTMFKHLDFHMKKDIAKEYGLSAKILESWLQTLNYIRNICAHHSRLWNRELAIKPVIPERKHIPKWHVPIEIKNNRIFSILLLLSHFLDITAPTSKWKFRTKDLFTKYENIPLKEMGMPHNWISLLT